MKILAQLAFCLILASPAWGDWLPVFDEQKGFEIMGSAPQAGMLLVRNGETVFICDVRADVREPYVVLSDCKPVIGPDAAQNDVESNRSEVIFVEGLARMGTRLFYGMISETFQANNCQLDLEKQKDYFAQEIALRVSRWANYPDTFSDAAVNRIYGLAMKAVSLMSEQGIVAVNDNTLRLTKCD